VRVPAALRSTGVLPARGVGIVSTSWRVRAKRYTTAIAVRTARIRLPDRPSRAIRSMSVCTSLRRTAVTGFAAIASVGRTHTRSAFSISRLACGL
jgi:hypothetical protein